MMHGFSPACIFILPMLGRKPEEYPRFRDCFIEDGNIAIYTRVGGGNRNCNFGEEELYEDPYYLRTYDDDFDNTYGTYIFRVPDRWKADFDKLLEGKFTETSKEYQDYLRKFYPKLNTEGFFDQVFSE